MSLHTHKAHFQPGAAEAVSAVLIGVVAFIFGSAALLDVGPPWALTHGVVERAHFYEPAYTALAPSQLVQLKYTYFVQGAPFVSIWEGDWPRAHSPNALAGREVDRLTQPGYSLFVWYDPADPSRNSLHGDGARSGVIWRWGLSGVALGLWLIIVRIYPRLKARLHAWS